jgi:hypothetical protein
VTDSRWHTYRMRYDDGGMEEVRAVSPSMAVAERKRPAMPVAITNMTLLDAFWRSGEGRAVRLIRAQQVIHAEPGDY